MKETVFSIRAYFGIVGLLGVIRGIFLFIASSQDWTAMIDGSITLFIGAGFLYSSIKLPELLKTSTKVVQVLLYITMGINALAAVFTYLSGMHIGEAIIPVIMIMIPWYLLINVKRLEEEYKAK